MVLSVFSFVTNVLLFRVLLKKPNHDDEVPGKPKEAEKLFVPPRSRRRSSAILNCSAAAVVKAVLLLRRNSNNETESKFSFSLPAKRPSSSQGTAADFPKPTSAPARDCRRKLHESSKSPTIGRRPKSVRGQFAKNTSQRSNSRVAVVADAKPSPRTKVKSPKTLCDSKVTVKDKSKIKQRKNKQSNREKKSQEIKTAFKVPLSARSAKEATINVKSRTNSPSFLPSVAVEKNVVQKPNVVIKEIINTGIPGRRFSPKTYRRFERSLFDVLDNPPKYEHSSSDEESAPAKSPVLNPWNVSLVASKWMSTIRQRRKSANSPSPEVSDETGQPPIIVIEDWAPGAALGEDESEDKKGFQLSTSRKTATRRTSRTPTPALDDVTEESEEEIQQYEHELMPSQRYRLTRNKV